MKNKLINNPPMVTIVTVCLNSEKYLEQTIKSVINQAYDNIEYIIIDGGSTDGTLDIIKKYENFIDKWISEPDSGIYEAMNKGIDIANGELIGFLNSDDYYYSKKSVDKIVEKYIKTNADVISGKMEKLNKEGKRVKISSVDFSKIKLEKFHIIHPSTFVKTDIMKKYKFDTNYKIVSDYKFFLNLFVNNYKFENINEIVASFREGGISSSREKEKEKNRVDFEQLGISLFVKKKLISTLRIKRRDLLVLLIGKNNFYKLREGWGGKKDK